MVAVKIGDGLGNQIYNYVCGYAVARHDGEELLLDTSECDNSVSRPYLLDKFLLDSHRRESFSNKSFWHKVYKRLRRNLKYHVIMENKQCLAKYDARLFIKKRMRNKYIHGYWQNIKYFQMYEKDILRQLKPAYVQSSVVVETREYLKANATCAIHLRGGDIQMKSSEYYKRAVDVMNMRRGELIYIVFTNQRQQAEEVMSELQLHYKFINDYGDFTDVDEFFLMSSCCNQIIPDSTFSRWAALLNDNREKIVVVPDLGEKNIDTYPGDWVIV